MSTIFKRCSDEHWWHWMPKCVYYLSLPAKKKRGKTVVQVVVLSGWPTTYPGTYGLCPGCMAEWLRKRSRDPSIYVVRTVVFTPPRIVPPRVIFSMPTRRDSSVSGWQSYLQSPWL